MGVSKLQFKNIENFRGIRDLIKKFSSMYNKTLNYLYIYLESSWQSDLVRLGEGSIGGKGRAWTFESGRYVCKFCLYHV